MVGGETNGDDQHRSFQHCFAHEDTQLSVRTAGSFLFVGVKQALVKLGTGNCADSRILIVVAEGNDAGSLIKYPQIKKRAKGAHVQCFALLVADQDLIGGRVRHFGFDLNNLASAT